MSLSPDKMAERGDADKENEPPTKKRRVSLSLKGKQKQPIHQCFGQADDGDLEAASRGVVPTNTSRNNRWALNNYREWKKSRQSSSEPVPEGLLSSRDDQLLYEWLCRFAMETRQENLDLL